MPEALRSKLSPGLALLTLSVMLILQSNVDWMEYAGWFILVFGAIAEFASK